MTFPVQAFPRAYTVDRVDELVVEQTDAVAGPLLTRVPDDEIAPDIWLLAWDDAPGVIGQALREHYADHHAEVWDWQHPSETLGETRKVLYLTPPEIAWGNHNRIRARVTLATATAYE